MKRGEGGRERVSGRGREKERGVSEWMVVKGGGVAGLQETEDKKSEAKV